MAEADMVTLTLGYPLSAAQAERVLAQKVRDYWIGDDITVPKSHARSIIAAGYAAGVDPADAEAVEAVLRGVEPEAPGRAAEAEADSKKHAAKK